MVERQGNRLPFNSSLNYLFAFTYLIIFTKNNEVGESKQIIKGAIEGESISLSFNHRYIFDCLQSIDGESIVLKVAGAGKPLVISPASNNSFTYLVMSMNR